MTKATISQLLFHQTNLELYLGRFCSPETKIAQVGGVGKSNHTLGCHEQNFLSRVKFLTLFAKIVEWVS